MRWTRVEGRLTGEGPPAGGESGVGDSVPDSVDDEAAGSAEDRDTSAVTGVAFRSAPDVQRQIVCSFRSIRSVTFSSHRYCLEIRRFDRSDCELYHSRHVIQRNSLLIGCFLALAALIGCDNSTSPPTSSSTSHTSTTTRIVSLSPAATDLLLAMGAENDLVGVSTFDSDPRVSKLPRLGDYENVDWERIQTLSPTVMIVQMAPDRLPAGFVDRAKKLNITLHSAKIDRFTDIIVESDLIGQAVGRPAESRTMWMSLRERIDDVKLSVEGKSRVKTLVVTSADGLGVAGPDTYLDDILGFAGGVNAVPMGRSGYTKVDRELLLTIAPDAIIQLLPGATPAQIEAANAVWKGLPEVPAVKNARIYTFTQDWVLMPNSHVAELSQQMAAKLHPEAK